MTDKTSDATSERELGVLRARIAELEERLERAAAQASGAARTLAPAGTRDLELEHARAQAILASMLDPMISIDDRGTIQDASDSVERVFGYAPAELLGRNIKLLMPEPHRSRHDGYLEHYRRTGETAIIGRTREFEMLCKDGRVIVCALSVSRAQLADGPAVFTGTFRDITDLERATQALAESERRFHALFDEAFQFIGLLDTNGRVLEINKTALHSIRITRDQVIGRPFWETPWWAPSTEMRERVRTAIEAAAQGEFVRFETHHTAGSGSQYETDFSLKPVKNEAGDVVLLIAEGRNISELKRAQRAETAMVRALASIGEQAAVLAHEIKNPITAVNLALRAVADQLGTDQQQVLEELTAGMKRLEALMRRTLSFAKPLQLQREEVVVERLFADALASMSAELERGKATVAVFVDHADSRLVADPHHLGEVLTNLMRNAIEAKGSGSHIELHAAPAGKGWLRIHVDDDGPGGAPEVRADVFRPFVTTKNKGTGLGLAICKKIVDEHGGTLTIVDAPRGGARFVLELPTGL